MLLIIGLLLMYRNSQYSLNELGIQMFLYFVTVFS